MEIIKPSAILAALLCLDLPEAASAASAASEQAPLIAVDVGHSLAKPGAISARGVREFDFNHALALTIVAAIEDRSLRTLLINGDGAITGLVERADSANQADILVSVHHDSVQPRYLSEWDHRGRSRLYSDRFRGFSLFVSRSNPKAEVSLRCASRMGRHLVAAGFRPSGYHSKPIAGENRPFADEAHGVHYYDDLVVLKATRSPAILLEAGVIVHREEEEVLGRPEVRRRMAAAIAAGLHECLSGGPPP